MARFMKLDGDATAFLSAMLPEAVVVDAAGAYVHARALGRHPIADVAEALEIARRFDMRWVMALSPAHSQMPAAVALFEALHEPAEK